MPTTRLEPTGRVAVLSATAVCKYLGFARSTLYRKVARGTFPRPIQLGPGRVGWRSDEVEDWLQARPRA